ncbi:MAG: hypothetical protein WD407_12535 [Rhodospirillales bacterium]
MTHQFTRFFFVVVLALGASACAVDRSVIALQQAEEFKNPTDGTAVKITEVKDARIFLAAPPTPDIPSLSDREDNSAAIKSRAIARKRNGYGMAIGDVILPEGQTVAGVVEKAIAEGFKGAGYRVHKPGDSGYDVAASISARIDQFWAWVNIGFASGTLNNKSTVNVRAPLPGLEQGADVNVHVKESLMAVFESDWQAISLRGLKELTKAVREKLKK